MATVTASLLAGLGLFFVGLYFLTEHLKKLSGRKLRERISSWTKNRFLGLAWGGVFIAITQSTAATMFILVSMLRSGMMTIMQTMPIIIGLNMMAGAIILVLVIDIKVAILFLLGITGIAFTNDKARNYRNFTGAVFGICLLFLGLNMMREGVAPLAQTEWFEQVLHWTMGSLMLGFMIGAVLSVLVQSSVAVVVLTIAFQQAGLFKLSESIMVVYGANVGSSILTLMLSTSLSGESKQLAMYQTAYNFIGAILLVPAFYLELYGEVPLVKAFTESITSNAGGQIAIVNLLFNGIPGVILLLTLSPCVRLLKKLWPETLEEQMAKPKFLHDRAADDPDTGMDLIVLEQSRLVEFLASTFTEMRAEGDRGKLPGHQEAFRTLNASIREVISDLSTRHQLTDELYDRLNHLLNLQQSLESAFEVIDGLADEFLALEKSETGARFVGVAIEGLDTILLTLIDIAREKTEENVTLLRLITSEEGNGISAVRSAYLAEEGKLMAELRNQLLAAANHCERLVWLFGRMGESFVALAA